MDKQMENIIKYSNDSNAKTILKNEKVFNCMYVIVLIIISILYIFFAIKSTFKITILYFIIAIIMVFYKKYRFNKLLKKYMQDEICLEGVLNLSIYYAKKIITTNKSYNNSMNNIAFAFIELGEFEKAENVLQHLENRNLNNFEKCFVIKNRMRMFFLKNDIDGFRNEKEKLIKILELIPSDKYKKQIMLSTDLQEAVFNNDYDSIDKIGNAFEKNTNLYNRISFAYYRGYVLEKKANKEYEKYYKFIADNGKNLFIANIVRNKLNINNRVQGNKLKGHLGLKIILLIILSIFMILIFSVYDYNYEKTTIKWDTGKIQLLNNEIILPCDIEEFEKITGIDIDEDKIDKLGFYDINFRNPSQLTNRLTVSVSNYEGNGISLYIKNNVIMGVKIDISNYYNDNLDTKLGKLILFPNNVNTNISLGQLKKVYNTGALNFFVREWNEKLSNGKYSSGIKYSGNNYDIEIQAIDKSIKSIFYYYKY